jgi:hypothetical protein
VASSSGRVVTLCAVSQGNLFTAVSGDTTWSSTLNATANTPPLPLTGVVRSAVLNQVLWFATGGDINATPPTGMWCAYSPLGQTVNQLVIAPNTIATWTPGVQDLLGNPTTSLLPVDSDGNLPTLIVNWRSRLCLAGLLNDPQSIFMSAIGDPTNFDYVPQFTSTNQAVALDPTGPAGYVGDVVTGLIPYTNDVLIIGGDHTMYMCQGDPANGGTVTLISSSIGMAFGQAWCMDPYGNIFWVSNRTGIYSMMPGNQPQRISQQIEQLLQNIDTGLNTITMLWDDRFQGIHVFMTPTANVTPYAVVDDNQPEQLVTHFFYEARTGAWWEDQFVNPNHNPLCNVTFDGNAPGDRVPLIGSWDGYVRAIDPFATDDDGFPIDSAVILGPILSPDTSEMLLHEVQGVLGETSGEVSYEILAGTTAEEALTSTPVATGTFGPGRNSTDYVRRSGHAIYLRLTASNPWSMECVRTKIQGLGKIRERRKY